MGWSKRSLVAVALVMLVASAGLPALPGAPASVDPTVVPLPVKGENATTELEVVKDSVVLSAQLSISGSPIATTEGVPVAAGTSIGFEGGVDFVDPDPDLSWYFDSIISPDDLDNASVADGKGVLTTTSSFAFQMFLVTVDPVDLYSMQVSWRGRANATVASVTYEGAVLYVLNNATHEWEAMDAYSDLLADDHTLTGQPLLAPWRYVNRTLTGEEKVIVLVISHRGFDSRLFTDEVVIYTERQSYPRPRMDLGADGTVDWGFGTSEATGSLGRVAAFDDGTREVPITLPLGGGHNDSAAVLVPKGAHVEEAYLDYNAFPTRGERADNGDDVVADAGSSSEDLVVGNIPLLSHSHTSSVLLTNAMALDVPEQWQERGGGSPELYIGWGTFWAQSVAQTFKPKQDGPLHGVEVYITNFLGDPGNITMEIRDVNAAQPGGLVLGTSRMSVWDVTIANWYLFSFTGVYLNDHTEYAIVLYAEDAPLNSNLVYLDYNASDVYQDGTLFVSQTVNASMPWTVSSADLTFRTYMDVPLDPAGAANLEVLGAWGNMVEDRIYFNLSDVEYDNGSWSFQVENGNPHGVRFDWVARTTYLLYAEDPTIDVGDDGSVEWAGVNVSSTAPLDITMGLRRVMERTDWPHVHVDLFGNTLYRVPFNLSANSEGEVALRNVVVYYTGSVTTSDLAADINTKKAPLAADGNGTVRIPINFTSRTTGTVNITSVDVEYDLPPYSLEISDIQIPEDVAMDPPLYLDSIIFDDLDNNALEYTVVREEGDEALMWNLSVTNVLTFSGPANWSGGSTFHILAEDTRDLVHRTNSFTVTIVPVNDPPQLLGLPEALSPSWEVPTEIVVDLLDNDSPLENITIATDSASVTVDRANLTITFLYGEGAGNETVHVSAFDGVDSTMYSIDVSPIESNELPVIGELPVLEISLDRQEVLNLTPYATDLESSQDLLVWSIEDFPNGLVVSMGEGNVLQVIPVATTTGTYTINLSVMDPDGNRAYADLVVDLIERESHPPVILRGDDALPTSIKVRRNGKVVLDLALIKYWYDQEDHNRPNVMRWEATSLRPNLFSVEMDNINNRLTISAFGSTGSGYMTLKLFDSDNEPSPTESVQIEVYEPTEDGASWTTFVIACILVVVVVALLAAASRRRGEAAGKPPASPTPPTPPKPTEARAREEAPSEPEEEAEEREEAPGGEVEPIPGRILEVMMIHESTSLITQRGDRDHVLDDEKADELIELATLFAQERFEEAKVGTIKAFKFDGNEVLVGKGLNYYLVVRCTGNEFDDVATEIKRSIINIDVNLGERLRDWYPGQKVSALEEEVRSLLEQGDR